jgi:hypothetical protein
MNVYMYKFFCCVPVRQQSLIDSPFSLHVTVACRHVKQNDSFTSTYFTLGFLILLLHSRSIRRRKKKLQDFLSESLLFGFQDEIMTSNIFFL